LQDKKKYIMENLKNTFAGDKFKQDLIAQIESGNLISGEAILSERKLAEKYNIGYMTVRRAVDDLVEMGLLYRVPRKGTFVNEKTAAKKDGDTVDGSNMIAIVMSDLQNQFSNRIIEGVERKARQHGYQLLVYNSELDVTLEATHLKSVIETGVAGVILSPCFPPVNMELAQKLKNDNVPLVLIDKYFETLKTDFVTCDNFDAAYRAVKYLVSMGHKKIAHITSHSSLRNISSIKMRYEGYLKALKEFDIEFVPEYVQELDEVSVHTEMRNINLNYLGYEPMKKLLELPEPPTAVFLLFDLLAVGAYRAIKSEGLSVPNDISIIGFDNVDFSCYMDVPLTTMAQPVQEIGETAVAVLLERILEPWKATQEIRLKTQIITRNSCGIYAPAEALA
jgi:DNA-binding LacI/PurR family transcriptional regulator